MPDTAFASAPVDLEQARRAYTRKADAAEVWRNFEYDMDRFQKHSSTVSINPDPVALEAFLTSAYHSLEKGLTMEVPKAGFGLRKIRPILAAIQKLESLNEGAFATQGARGCIQSYVTYHNQRGLPLPTEVEDELRAFVSAMDNQTFPGGAIKLSRREIDQATDFDYDRFIMSRCSVRHFTGDPIAPGRIRTAVRRAIKSPRSCNREMRRVYVAQDEAVRNQLLTYHNGNRGFGDKLGAVMVITVDLREFDMIGERNQCWIDGGLFAMSLVYALHADGLGTCMLNWSEDCEQDKKLRGAFDIPDNEVVITFIGVGNIPEDFEVAASPSPELDDIMSTIRMK